MDVPPCGKGDPAWCLVTDRRVNGLSIVEAFDPIDDIEFRLRPGFIAGPMDSFYDFQIQLRGLQLSTQSAALGLRFRQRFLHGFGTFLRLKLARPSSVDPISQVAIRNA